MKEFVELLRKVGFQSHNNGGIYYKNYWHVMGALRVFDSDIKNPIESRDDVHKGKIILSERALNCLQLAQRKLSEHYNENESVELQEINKLLKEINES